MKIKIIDLLNKIANGEEVPKRIKVESHKFEYDECMNTYFGISEEYRFFSLIENWLNNSTKLNDEVEIKEEDEPIEDLKIARNEKNNQMFLRVENHHATMRRIDVVFATKINELVEEINKIKEK